MKYFLKFGLFEINYSYREFVLLRNYIISRRNYKWNLIRSYLKKLNITKFLLYLKILTFEAVFFRLNKFLCIYYYYYYLILFTTFWLKIKYTKMFSYIIFLHTKTFSIYIFCKCFSVYGCKIYMNMIYDVHVEIDLRLVKN